MKPGKNLRIPRKNQASNQIKARERDHRLMEPPPSATSGDAPDEGADVLPGELLPDLDPSSVSLGWMQGCSTSQRFWEQSSVTVREELKQPVRSFSQMGGTIQELSRNYSGTIQEHSAPGAPLCPCSPSPPTTMFPVPT